MASSRVELNNALSEELGRLPAVFSTPQWGGRAYKLPNRDGSRARPKLLAFVMPREEPEGVSVQFKLPRKRAAALVDEHAWIRPHAFGSLGGAGWVDVTLTRLDQLPLVRTLLRESHAQYPAATEPPQVADRRGRRRGSEAVVRRIATVMRDDLPDGWVPDPDR